MSQPQSVMTIDRQVELIMHGCEFGDAGLEHAMHDQLRARLTAAQAEARPLRVYAGYDPTAPDLHLGHAIPLRKLCQFQDLGHDVTVVIGTMTALIGDTSDKATGRPRRDPQEVRSAAMTYAEQAFLILDRGRTTIASNADWLSMLSLAEIIEMASVFTVQQFLARDNYRRRIERGDSVGLHEFLYALLQAYDAVHLRCDVQIGGSDQLFNIRASGRLQESVGQLPSVTLTYPLLVGTDGSQKMSKSLGNYVGLAESPNEQFGKVMSISDDTMQQWAPLTTDWRPEQVETFLADVRSGALHPMEAKKRLASRIVALYHGEQAAAAAELEFQRVHQLGLEPEIVTEVTISPGSGLVAALVDSGLVATRSAARRLVLGGGVSIDGVRAFDPYVELDEDGLIRVGRRRYLRVTVVERGTTPKL